jgi:hypothetical protein
MVRSLPSLIYAMGGANYRVTAVAPNYSLFVDYRVQLESLPSVYGQLSHTPKSLKRL